MRVLLSSVGTRGDIQPLIALGLGLREAGHEPLVCAPPNFGAWIGTHGLQFHPIGEDTEVFVRSVGTSRRAQANAFRRQVPLQFRDLEGPCAEADLIVNSSLCVATPSLAEKFGKPSCGLFFAPSMIPSRAHPAWLFERPTFPSFLNRASWSVYRVVADLLYRRPLNRERERLGLPLVRDAAASLLLRPSIVASEPAFGGIPSDAGDLFVQTGALFYDDPAPLESALVRFLAKGPAPVYVGFGSMPDADCSETTRLLLEASAAVGVRLVVSAGWADLGSSQDHPDVLFVGATPHTRLFPLMAGIVHHGGAGTTAAAALAGVPQLLVPHLYDQFYFARAVYAAGLSPPPLPRSRLTGVSLQGALAVLAADEQLRAAARDFPRRMVVDGVARTIRTIAAVATAPLSSRSVASAQRAD